MLCAVLAFLTCGLAVYGADEAADKKELQRIKREMQGKKKDLKRADRKERSILSELDRIDRDIQSGSAELADQRKRLQESEAALRELQQRDADINRELAGLKGIYAQRLRALYKMSRSGSAVTVFSADGPNNALKRLKYISVIAERDRALMTEYSNALERLALRHTEIAETQQELLSRRRVVEAKRTELESRKQKKTVLLSSVREKKGLYEQTLRELEESSTSLWAMIRKDEQERKAAKAAAPPPVKAARPSSSGRNSLDWPVAGQVLSRFGMQRHPQFGTMVFRRGIEIAAREGESVRSVENGQVAHADWYKGYGQLVILDHGNGFYSLYGNLQRVDVAKGDRILKGQAIGLVGETGSLKGSKLYFEIRRQGEAQDPLAWLAKK